MNFEKKTQTIKTTFDFGSILKIAVGLISLVQPRWFSSSSFLSLSLYPVLLTRIYVDVFCTWRNKQSFNVI